MGRAVALGLAREGARVAICARNADGLQAAARELAQVAGEEGVLAVTADLSRPGDVTRVVRETLGRWGKVAILVNNVGGPPLGTPSELDDAHWPAALELNFLSAVRMARAVLPSMRKQRWGRIINMLSFVVKEPIEGLVLSTAARLGVVGFAKMLADEVAAEGVTVNNALPGYVLTDRLRALAQARAQREGSTTEEVLKAMARPVAARRLGRPEEMADLVCFLASERAAYITGASIFLDGGLTRSTL
jgi:3-oxoacyl-[acyl-carrier protein] reductase